MTDERMDGVADERMVYERTEIAWKSLAEVLAIVTELGIPHDKVIFEVTDQHGETVPVIEYARPERHDEALRRQQKDQRERELRRQRYERLRQEFEGGDTPSATSP